MLKKKKKKPHLPIQRVEDFNCPRQRLLLPRIDLNLPAPEPLVGRGRGGGGGGARGRRRGSDEGARREERQVWNTSGERALGLTFPVTHPCSAGGRQRNLPKITGPMSGRARL